MNQPPDPLCGTCYGKGTIETEDGWSLPCPVQCYYQRSLQLLRYPTTKLEQEAHHGS